MDYTASYTLLSHICCFQYEKERVLKENVTKEVVSKDSFVASFCERQSSAGIYGAKEPHNSQSSH